jgi:hypothetical protein
MIIELDNLPLLIPAVTPNLRQHPRSGNTPKELPPLYPDVDIINPRLHAVICLPSARITEHRKVFAPPVFSKPSSGLNHIEA